MIRLNSITTSSEPVLRKLLECLPLLNDCNGVCIFASSSTWHCTLQICDKKIKSLLQTLRSHVFEKKLESDSSQALSLIRNVCPSGESAGVTHENDLIITNTLFNSLCILLSILLYLTSRDRLFEVMNTLWREVNDAIFCCHTGRSCTRRLLLALVHNLPIAVFDIEEEEIKLCIPWLCNMISFDDTLIPRLTLPIPTFAIRDAIRALSEVLLLKTDDASAIGYIFERASLGRFHMATYQIASKDSDITTFCLPPVTVTSGVRFQPGTATAGRNIVWQFPIGTFGVDAFTCTEDAFILFQVSTTATEHQRKVEKINLIHRYISEMASRFKKQIYIYI